ncbi:MAG: HAD family phosphatase [Thermoflexaceae bacterium]|nr:HAD family phosphatase [Thermoflexaceae bacterium]
MGISKKNGKNILQGIEAVLFDLDGTLIDSMWIWREIDIAFLGERNIPMPQDLQKIIEGKSFHETAVYFKETFQLPESLEEIKDIWNRMAFDRYAHGMQLKSGADKFLKKLCDAGIRMGIATSNSRHLTECCLTDIGILKYFETIVTGCDVVNGKPQPDIYLKAADNLKILPDKCLVFEDVPMGILAGKHAGMRTCAVYDSFSAHMDEEKKKLSDYYITSYEELV